MDEKGKIGTFSRRDFLRFSGIGAASIAAASSLAGCETKGASASAASSQKETSSASSGKADNAVSGGEPKFELINTDVLIIGAGLNAMSAASQALAEGLHVTLVDKAPYRHGGTSGLSWDAFTLGNNTPPESYAGRILNGKLMRNALAFDPYPEKFIYMINHGQTIADRNDDGSFTWYLIPGVLSQSLFFRRENDDFYNKRASTIYDQTMITDLIINNGRCLGAVGIHLPTGSFRVFRSPATILATGACTNIYGWFTVSACSIGTSDNTSDADMAAYRHGAGIGDSEYAQYDVLSCEPPGLAVGFGSGVCGDSQEAHAIFDKNGDLVFDLDDPRVFDRVYFNQRMGQVIVEEGRGTESGGVIINVGESHIRYSNERNIDLLKKFGIDVRKQSIEAVPEMYEHGGTPVVDENLMTEFAGLFHARGAGTAGETGGAQVLYNKFFGTYAGHCAAEYLKEAGKIKEIDWTPVIAEYDRLQKIRTSNDASGLRPHIIRRHIQAAGYKALGVYRSTELMEEAIAEFERIRSEEIPKMIVSDSSPTFNKEWKEAIENYNMLDLAEMSTRASLLREETRGMYLRAEFPEKDDKNWACMLVCRNKNGVMDFEKVTLPAI